MASLYSIRIHCKGIQTLWKSLWSLSQSPWLQFTKLPHKHVCGWKMGGNVINQSDSSHLNSAVFTNFYACNFTRPPSSLCEGLVLKLRFHQPPTHSARSWLVLRLFYVQREILSPSPLAHYQMWPLFPNSCDVIHFSSHGNQCAYCWISCVLPVLHTVYAPIQLGQK